MNLGSFSGLKAAVAEYLGQDNLTSQMDVFVNIAESRFDYRLRVREQENFANSTIVAGDTTIDLPENFRGMRALHIVGEPNLTIQYVSPEQLNEIDNTAGRPKYFTIRKDKILLNCESDSTYVVRIHYVAKFSSLSNSNTSNWILAEKPEVYLYGTLQAACEYTRDDTAAANYGALFNIALQELKNSDEYEKHGPVPVMKTEGIRW